MRDRRGSSGMAGLSVRDLASTPQRRQNPRRQHQEEGMDLELRGRTAVVTGCSVGIGREIARVLASEGVPTLVVARRGELLKTLQDEIEGAGWVRPHALAIDLADRAASTQVRDEALSRLGHVDILINNAGGSRPTAMDAGDAV